MVKKENFQATYGPLDYYVEESGQVTVNPGTRREMRYDSIEYRRILGPDDRIAVEFYVVSLYGRYGIIDRAGKLVVRIFYDEFCEVFLIEKGGAPSSLHFKMRMGQKYGIVLRSSKVLIPFNYDEIEHLIGGYAIRQKNKWGFLNDEGQFIIWPKYTSYTLPRFQFNYGELGTLHETTRTGFEFYNRDGDVLYECSAIKVWRYIGIDSAIGKKRLAENAFIVKEAYLGGGLYTFRILVFSLRPEGLAVVSCPMAPSDYIEGVIEKEHLDEYIVYAH